MSELYASSPMLDVLPDIKLLAEFRRINCEAYVFAVSRCVEDRLDFSPNTNTRQGE